MPPTLVVVVVVVPPLALLPLSPVLASLGAGSEALVGSVDVEVPLLLVVSDSSFAFNSAISEAVRNRPPGPLGLEQACLWRDSWRYGWGM